jgi:pyruvate kinase
MEEGMNLPAHKTKIVCTIGPASRDAGTIKKLIRSGMNVARLNFSHGNLDEHEQLIKTIRTVAAELGAPVAILADLPGPKIRVGRLLEEPLILSKGQIINLKSGSSPSRGAFIPVNYGRLPESVKRGSSIYISDGSILVKVLSVSGDEVQCRVVVGGELLSHKGINLPKSPVFMEAVSQTELDLVEFGINNGLSMFSVSFVERGSDIRKVKDVARTMGKEIHAIAKIERAQAIEHIDDILNEADGLMVARGDLGVEMPIEKVAIMQKSLITKANARHKPVITATQMLLSMTENTRPTRAESTDVANAILDGSDALMLSEETAIGSYPVQAVRMMARIASAAEKHRKTMVSVGAINENIFHQNPYPGISETVAMAVSKASRMAKPEYIVTPTLTGATALRMAQFKPDAWILSISPSPEVTEFLALSYGVYPFTMTPHCGPQNGPQNVLQNADWHRETLELFKKQGLGRSGDTVILTNGQYSPQHRSTDSMSVFMLE